MLEIRHAQLEALGLARRARLITQMVGELRASFPAACEAFSDEALYEFVDHGVRQAATYRIDRANDVFGFVSIMLVLGRDFDQDPRLPWVRDMLDPANRRSASARVAQVRAQAAGILAHFPEFSSR